MKNKYFLLAFILVAIAGCDDVDEVDNLKTDEITNNAAVIEWETDELSDSVVLFGEYPDGPEKQVQDNSFVTLHRIKLTGLKRDTSYFYSVMSCNPGICFFSETYNFTTTDKSIVSRAIKIDSLQILNEYAKPGEDIGTHIRIENNHNADLDYVRITMIIPELGIRKRVGPFDIDGDIDKEIHLTLPDDVEPGDYIVKIITTNNNQDFRRVKHRYITVI